jgi:predicted enzyme related to lactoylglutathione lyase
MSNAKHNFQVDYIEFPATDLLATKHFYNEVFGWTFKDWGPDYTSFHDGRIGGGFWTAAKPTGVGNNIGQDSAIGPLVVIYVINLEDTYKRITESGGKIVRETFEFPGGKRFHFADPSGNVLAAWSE